MIEVAFALGILSFCLIAIVGLLPIGLQSNQAAIEQTAAASVACTLVADLQTAPPGGHSRWGLQIPCAGECSDSMPSTIFLGANGQPLAASNGSASEAPRYRASIAFTPPDANQKTATGVRILITWPPMADGGSASWPSKFSGSYEVVTALERN